MAAVKAGMAVAALLLIAAKPLPAPVAAPAAAPGAATVRAGVEKWKANDYAGAVAIWQPFAAAGDADALFNMGQAYKLGRGVTQDAAAARDYYRKAAVKGHLPAQANLGIALFQVGEKPEAIKWLRTAADRGEARAQYVLGIAAYNGDGMPRSQSVGYGYLLRAQASGLPQATVALGSIAPALSPTDRSAGEAGAASLASGNGIPAALAAATAPKLILPPGGGVLKPLPVTTTAPVQVAVAKPVAAATKPTTVAAAPTPTPSPTPAPRQVAIVPPSPSKPVVVAPVSTPPIAVANATPVPQPATTVRTPVTAPVQGPVLDSGARPATSPPITVATTDVPASKPLPAPTPPPVVVAAAPPAVVTTPVARPPVRVAEAPKSVATAALKPFETIIPDKPVARKPGWRVQLGAFSARKQADTAWAAAKSDAGTAKPIFNTDGPVVKLQIGPFATRDAAKAACAKLSDAGRSCFVTEGG